MKEDNSEKRAKREVGGGGACDIKKYGSGQI